MEKNKALPFVIAWSKEDPSDVIANRERTNQSHIINCHCEERSDMAISTLI